MAEVAALFQMSGKPMLQPVIDTALLTNLARPRGEENILLRALSSEAPGEYDRLLCLLDTVILAPGAPLFEAGDHLPFVFFPETAVMSLMKILEDGDRIEVATAGRDSMLGILSFFDDDTAKLRCIVRIGGTARKLSPESLRSISGDGTVLHAILCRYAAFFFDQCAQSAACVGLHHARRRFARWLLATLDRVDGDRFYTTHAVAGTMLGLRRAGVTIAAGELQDMGFIRYRRGKLTILDRAGLESAACECYRSDRAGLKRLSIPSDSPRA